MCGLRPLYQTVTQLSKNCLKKTSTMMKSLQVNINPSKSNLNGDTK